MLPDARIAELTRRYQQKLRTLDERTAAKVKRIWDDLGSWDRADIDRFAALIEEPLAAAAKSTIRLSNGYHSKLVGKRPPAFPLDEVSVIPPDPEAAFLSHWKNLSEGVAFEESVAKGFLDLANDITGFVNSTARQAADVSLAKSGTAVVGWRRVLTGVSCEWCAQVSTQRYRSADSADFGHRSCDCTVVAIVGDRDPGQYINRDLAKRLDQDKVGDRLYARSKPSKSLKAADNATARRDATLDELAAESDQQRRRRLEARARSWDRKARSYKAQAATQQTELAQMKPANSTGYVDPSGAPAPPP